MSDQNLGEQALSKAAELAIKSQLDETEQVNVSMHTNPVKLMQGKVDSVTVAGEGMVMKQDLRVEAMGIEIDTLAIDPLKAVSGEIDLTEPATAQMQVLLTEADLNRALSSEYLKSKIQELKVDLQGDAVLVALQQIMIKLPQAGEMGLQISFEQKPAQDSNQSSDQRSDVTELEATVKPFLADAGNRIGLEILSFEGQGITLEFANALLGKLVELLDLRQFELNGISMQLKDFDVQAGKVLLRGISVVEKLDIAQ
jgi:hypothetical protein